MNKNRQRKRNKKGLTITKRTFGDAGKLAKTLDKEFAKWDLGQRIPKDEDLFKVGRWLRVRSDISGKAYDILIGSVRPARVL